MLWHPSAVIIALIDSEDVRFTRHSYHVPSTRSTTGTAFVLLTPVRLDRIFQCETYIPNLRTTRSCHTTSYPLGQSIQRHLERSFYDLGFFSFFSFLLFLPKILSQPSLYLSWSVGRCLLPLLIISPLNLVRVTGLEPARSFEPLLLRQRSLPISSHPHWLFRSATLVIKGDFSFMFLWFRFTFICFSDGRFTVSWGYQFSYTSKYGAV